MQSVVSIKLSFFNNILNERRRISDYFLLYFYMHWILYLTFELHFLKNVLNRKKVTSIIIYLLQANKKWLIFHVVNGREKMVTNNYVVKEEKHA